MQMTINLSDDQRRAVEDTAAETGRDQEQVVLDAVDLLMIRRELGADGYAQLMAGLADDEAERYASDEEVDAVFSKYGVRRR